ncbi:hypothetical protein PCE1_003884 [Barthelona sp. PCE]
MSSMSSDISVTGTPEAVEMQANPMRKASVTTDQISNSVQEVPLEVIESPADTNTHTETDEQAEIPAKLPEILEESNNTPSKSPKKRKPIINMSSKSKSPKRRPFEYVMPTHFESKGDELYHRGLALEANRDRGIEEKRQKLQSKEVEELQNKPKISFTSRKLAKRQYKGMSFYEYNKKWDERRRQNIDNVDNDINEEEEKELKIRAKPSLQSERLLKRSNNRRSIFKDWDLYADEHYRRVNMPEEILDENVTFTPQLSKKSRRLGVQEGVVSNRLYDDAEEFEYKREKLREKLIKEELKDKETGMEYFVPDTNEEVMTNSSTFTELYERRKLKKKYKSLSPSQDQKECTHTPKINNKTKKILSKASSPRKPLYTSPSHMSPTTHRSPLGHSSSSILRSTKKIGKSNLGETRKQRTKRGKAYKSSIEWEMRKKEKIEQLRKKIEEEEKAKCTFSPSLDQTTKIIAEEMQREGNLYSRGVKFLEYKERHLNRKRELLTESELDGCTFSPVTAKTLKPKVYTSPVHTPHRRLSASSKASSHYLSPTTSSKAKQKKPMFVDDVQIPIRDTPKKEHIPVPGPLGPPYSCYQPSPSEEVRSHIIEIKPSPLPDEFRSPMNVSVEHVENAKKYLEGSELSYAPSESSPKKQLDYEELPEEAQKEMQDLANESVSEAPKDDTLENDILAMLSDWRDSQVKHAF